MNQADKKTFENNMHHHDTMKTIAKGYCFNNREYSVQEAVRHILPIFPAVYFVNANLPEERFQVLLPKKELGELPDYSLNIFKRSNSERPSAKFYIEK